MPMSQFGHNRRLRGRELKSVRHCATVAEARSVEIKRAEQACTYRIVWRADLIDPIV